ncbi:E3 ubiquitin-protein ligase RBBP6-like [Megalobrama amblycephala]|uniref:E3 ubiquitin-protein ligase RBBP6-like n=1 Tax=Megalobrama amblycephala TaxID=75352 RepID=UPI00201439A8|nr:E3 ubiquitin-protein ligase RBBP6-like [Megalobrama amblycephala]
MQMPVKQTENLAEANASEEDKIKAVMYQSSLYYYSSSDAMKLLGLLPPNYICYRCGIPGHHIKNCPTYGDEGFAPRKRVWKCAGIPRSFLVEVDDPHRKGVMMDRRGKYVIPIMDAEAYAIGKKEKPPFSVQNEPSSSSDPVPDALLCLICKDLLTDAVMIPCCRSSYCDECIRMCLLESDGHVCPTCRQSDVSPDSLAANTVLRQEVNHFSNGTRSLQFYQSPNHSRQSWSPIPESSSNRGRDVRRKCSRSRSPLNSTDSVSPASQLERERI